MGNTVFQVLVAEAGETQLAVKFLEVGLGADPDGLATVGSVERPEGELHEGAAQAPAAGEGGGEYAPDAGAVGVADAAVEYAGVGGDFPIQGAYDMEGPAVLTIGIEVVTGLLHDEDLLSNGEEIVQQIVAQRGEGVVGPVDFHTGKVSKGPRGAGGFLPYFAPAFPHTLATTYPPKPPFPMRYYLIAGEASGDLHGAHLIEALLTQDPAAEIRAWGGELMAAAGAEIVKHYRELAFMGFVEVVKNLRTILGNLQACKQDIETFRPDRLVLIDYPGFNLRIAKWARPRGYDISYYISPQIWAWHTSRVHQIRANVDRMLVILPFEQAFYAEHGVRATFVGHPLLDVVRETKAGVAREDYIALLPGSRKQEISRSLPVMLAAAARLPERPYVVAAAPGQEEEFYRELISASDAPPSLRVVSGQTYTVLAAAHAAIVTSGTATLETALFGVPQVVVYRGNTINYWLARRLVASRIKYISLVNLVMDAPVVTELIQGEFTADRLTEELQKTIAGPVRDRQLNDLARLRVALGEGGAAARAAAAIVAPSPGS